MSRSLHSLSFTARLSGLAVCSLTALVLTGCETKGTPAAKGGKFQVASEDGKEKKTDSGGEDPAPGEGPEQPSKPNFQPKNGSGQESPSKPPVVPSEKLGDYRVPDGEPEVIQAF